MPTDRTAARLKLAAALVVIVGLLIALGAHPATAWPAILLADVTFWPLDGAQSLAAPETRLAYAVLGGVMAGWGATIWLIADRLYARDPATARGLVLAGLAVWFVTDSAASLAAGAPLNLVVNVGFLAVFLAALGRRSGPGTIGGYAAWPISTRLRPPFFARNSAASARSKAVWKSFAGSSLTKKPTETVTFSLIPFSTKTASSTPPRMRSATAFEQVASHPGSTSTISSPP